MKTKMRVCLIILLGNCSLVAMGQDHFSCTNCLNKIDK